MKKIKHQIELLNLAHHQSHEKSNIKSVALNAKGNNNNNVNGDDTFFCFRNVAPNRFIGKYGAYNHSKTLRVRVDFTSVHDLIQFKAAFKTKFEQQTGKGFIFDITISKYRNDNNGISQIDLVITFNAIFGYGFLNRKRKRNNTKTNQQQIYR